MRDLMEIVVAGSEYISVEIVAISSVYACFNQNSCSWPIIFQLNELQLAQTMRVLVEIVVISSDYVHFR